MPSQMENECLVGTHEIHRNFIHAIVVSGDNIITASKDKTTKVYNTLEDECKFTLEGHSYDVNALALAGNVLYTAADAKGGSNSRGGKEREYLKMWDLQTGEQLHDLRGHTNGVWALEAIPELGLLFSGGDDKDIRVWDTSTNECLRVLEGHQEKVRCLHYCSEDGKLYSGDHDGKVMVWDLQTWERVATFDGQSGWITAILVNEDTLYTASTEKTVYARNKDTGDKISILNHESWVTSLLMVGDTLLTGVGNGHICAWDPLKASVLFTLTGHLEFHAVSALCIKGDQVLSASWDGTVLCWSIERLHAKVEEARKLANAPAVEEKPNEEKPQKQISSSMFDDGDFELLD